MNKYIDAEKLIAGIKGIIAAVQTKNLPDMLGTMEQCLAAVEIEAFNCVLDAIKELQQDQPKPTCKNCGFYENNCPFIRGKLIPYPNRVCKDYTYSVMKEQEKPEVDLEKEIDAVWNPRFNLGWDEKSLLSINRSAFETIARHFWNKGYNARKEE